MPSGTLKKERIGEVLALIDRARERFRDKEIEKGLDVLRESQGKMTKKILIRPGRLSLRASIVK